MKVGTDAVLLGAWLDLHHAKTILDIGTGSGVIALMLAQRTNEEIKIDAVEPLPEDAIQASENVINSPWPNKISVFTTTIQKFNPGLEYDGIVCNPPFFSNSLLSPEMGRSKARHATTLTHDELLNAVGRLLSSGGRLHIILPFAESEDFILKACLRKLFINRLTRLFTRDGKSQERSLMELSLNQSNLCEDTLLLYQANNHWSPEYYALTRDFYLDR